MATRRVTDFIQGIESSTLPAPGTPSNDNDLVTKGYTDDTYAKLTSWQDVQTNIAGVKAIPAASRSDGQVVFIKNPNTALYEFDADSSATGDDDLVLTPDAGTGRWLKIETGGGGSGAGETLQFTPANYVSTFKAAESLAIRDLVGVILHNGSGSDEYKVVKCDQDNAAKPMPFGFAVAAATVTAGQYTVAISAAFVSGNVASLTLNGRLYSVTFASSSDATLEALRALIAQDPDVNTAAVTVIGGNQTGNDDREIVITTSNGINAVTGAVQLNFTSLSVTGGASQPTLSATTNTAPVQATCQVQYLGAMTGFSGLTTGMDYFASATAGAITDTAPTPGEIFRVGVATSTTSLFIDLVDKPTIKFAGRESLYKVSGFTNAATYGTTTLAMEAFNFASWASLANFPGTALVASHQSDVVYQKGLHVIDYAALSGGAATVDHRRFRGGSWTSLTNNSVARLDGTAYQNGGKLYVNQGGTNAHSFAGASARSDAWNGSWANLSNWAGGYILAGTFSRSDVLSMLGGRDSAGSYSTVHETMNTAETKSTSTAVPAAVTCGASGSAGAGANTGRIMHAANGTNTTNSYAFTGSWSSVQASVSSAVSGQNRYSGYQRSASKNWMTGGGTGATTLTATEVHNTASWSASTACTVAAAHGIGGVAS